MTQFGTGLLKVLTKDNIKSFCSSIPFFLIVSVLILTITIKYSDNIKYEELVEPEPKLETTIQETILEKKVSFEELEREEKDDILQAIHKCFLPYSNQFYCYRVVKGPTYVTYEIIYHDLDVLYLWGRNSEVEAIVISLCQKITDTWYEYGYGKLNINILVCSDINKERVYFEVINNQVAYTIYDPIQCETTLDDWKYLFIYNYGYEPSKEELEQYIITEEEKTRKQFEEEVGYEPEIQEVIENDDSSNESTPN